MPSTRVKIGRPFATPLALNLPTRPQRRSMFQAVVDRVLIACQLERRYSDPQLLRMVLKHEYFGRREFGLEAASNAEFGVSESQLSEAQAERLAVLPRAPNWLQDHPAEWDARAIALAARLNSRTR